MLQSAGGNAASYHLFSPLAAGLFRRCIAQSGLGGFGPSFHHYPAELAARYGSTAAGLLGCLDPDTRLAVIQSRGNCNHQQRGDAGFLL